MNTKKSKRRVQPNRKLIIFNIYFMSKEQEIALFCCINAIEKKIFTKFIN